MKNINPPRFFYDHFLLEKLTNLGDPLQKLSKKQQTAKNRKQEYVSNMFSDL